jgi:SAM-dependent methyltransferase
MMRRISELAAGSAARDSTPRGGLSARQQQLREQFDRLAPDRNRWIEVNRYFYDTDRAYMRFLVPPGKAVLEIGCGTGELLAALRPARGVGIDLSAAMIDVARDNHPGFEFHVGNAEDPALLGAIGGPFDFVILSDTIGYVEDCQALLAALLPLTAGHTRIIIAYYSRLWVPLLRFGERLAQKMPHSSENWLSTGDTVNLLTLAGYEVVSREWRQLLPKRLGGLGTLVNRTLAPLPGIRRLCLRNYIVGRPLPAAEPGGPPPSASIVVPCRNERGNIEAAVERLPRFCPDLEIIYVEGHSRDGTYEECLRVQAAHPDLDIKVFRQDGKGKGDAVRKGFAEARGDILIILDADLTVPPESLPKFYEALARRKAEFCSGTRLVYPMQAGAMRFLNLLGNRFFAAVFSFLLNQRFTDTLCGTKALWRKDYDELAANRGYFGDFDPFGDFDLMFGASKLNLKMVEIPVRYFDRTYGSTQISRFTHGWLLLRMTAFAWRKLKAF